MSELQEESPRADPPVKGTKVPDEPGPTEGAPAAASESSPVEIGQEDSSGQSGSLHAQASIYINGNVYADDSTWGLSTGAGGGRLRSLTGEFRVEIVAAATQAYARSDSHTRALAILQDQGYVILSGVDDSGKVAGALNLLRELHSERKIIGLSPLLTWADIANYPFRSETFYVVVNHRTGNYGTREPEHELRSLAAKFAQESTRPHLVLTTTSEITRRWESSAVVQWMAPDAAALVAAHLEHHRVKISDEQTRQLQEFAEACRSPRLVARLVARLADSQGDIAAIIENAQSGERSLIGRWLDDEPKRRDVATLAGMAFLAGAGIASVERHIDRLRLHLDHKAGAKRKPDKTGQLEQGRLHFREIPFVEIRSVPLVGANRSQQVAAFRHPLYRRQAIRELWHRYPETLWSAVRSWIIATVHDCDIQVASDAEFILRITSGLALLAEWSLDEVVERYVERWTGGNLPEKITAAVLLADLEETDSLVGTGLEIAQRWIKEGDGNESFVALLALSGKLGARYPDQALNLLWAFGHDSGRRASLAENAISALFAISVTLDGAPIKAIRFAIRLIDRVRKPIYATSLPSRSTPAGDDEASHLDRTRLQLRAFRLGLSLLRTHAEVDDQKCITDLLQRDPTATKDVATLCQLLLSNQRFRRDTIESIRKILDDSTKRFPTSQLHSEFAKVLSTGLSEEEVRRLRRDFEVVFSRPPSRGTDYGGFTVWLQDPPGGKDWR